MATYYLYLSVALVVLVSGPQYMSAQASLQQERAFIHYTDADGLPYSGITDFIQDETGFMWVATWINICRFDGHRFREFPALNFEGKPATLTWPTFFRDANDRQLYFRTYDNRIFKYNPIRAQFEEHRRLPGSRISNLQPAEQEGYWIAQDSSIFHLDSSFSNPVPIEEYFPFTAFKLKGQHCRRVVEKEGELYVVVGASRLVRIHPREKSIEELELPMRLGQITTAMFVDDARRIWIATEDAGLFRVDKDTGTTVHFSEKASGVFRIPDDFVRSIEQDNQGDIWIGTENGLCIWKERTGQMEIHQYDSNRPEGINSNAVYPVYCDQAGDVWVGTYFGGINLYSGSKEFFNIIGSGESDFSLSGQQVSSIVEDSSGNIYVGLEGDGFDRIDKATGKIKRFQHIDGKNSLSYDNVHTMVFDADQRLYIGTYTGGLNIYDPGEDRFSVINTKNSPALPDDNIFSLLAQGDSIFVGTTNGLAIYRVSSGEIEPFFEDVFSGTKVAALCRTGQELWISARFALYIYNMVTGELQQFGKFNGPVSISFLEADEEGNIWIGDNSQGLRVYWRAQDSVSHYAPATGFPAKRVYGMIPGKGDYFWISGNRGLIKFFPQTGNSVVYDRQSGLPFSQFNYLAYYKSRTGNIYFGGIKGLIYFNEEEGAPSRRLAPVVFTNFELFYEPLDPMDSPVLSKPIHLTESIRLKYTENVFTIHYSALNYTHPGRVQYAYYLEGFESGWNLVGNKKSVSYTNLSPGTYTFHVKASYDNAGWTAPVTKLKIVVAPPFYQSSLAYSIYGMLILAGLAGFYLVSVKIEKSKSATALEQKEKESQEKLNRLKLEFFTNVSHDFRTPLTLIMGPVQQLLRAGRIDSLDREKLLLVNRNAQRLLGLINQLMDFRKVDVGCEELSIRKRNVVAFVREVKQAFEVLAENRRIQLDYYYDVEQEEEVYFDPEKLERILFNLLSNAFKFTPEGGRIAINLRVLSNPDKQEGTVLFLTVRDNGIGIPQAHLGQVFDRFFKTELSSTDSVSGSGIGLAFVKSVVELHKGSITVASEEGAWTEFVVKIPVTASAYPPEKIKTAPSSYISHVREWMGPAGEMNTATVEIDSSPDKLDVLIVDDNAELLSFLQQSLVKKFNVLTAADGVEALKVVEKKKPDLIISDVVMPKMDGLLLTQHLKEDVETSHIPVILLTAKTDVDHHYEGFSAGADFYIEKPFYPHLLIKHVENILSTRNRLIKIFKRDLTLTPSEIAHSRPDQEFIEKLTGVIEDNMDNPDLDVSLLLREMCISRSLLHLKLKNIAHCSATEYIRSIRLKKAAKLILSGGRTIKEISYATGFSSPPLFSRCFKKYFGKSPREYAKLGNASSFSTASKEPRE